MIAVSTTSSDVMGSFAQLNETASMPLMYSARPYMDPNVLRYYVLVHDVQTGDMAE